MQYIDNELFQVLERLTINSGGNLACNTYIRFFQNKNNMTLENYENFKNDVRQELNLVSSCITPQQRKLRNELKDTLKI